MIHAIITLIICTPIILIPSIPNLLCFLPAFFYIGREVAQAEYRYIEGYCDRKRSNMPWYAVLTPKAWTVKGIFDFVLPLLVSSVTYSSRMIVEWITH